MNQFVFTLKTKRVFFLLGILSFSLSCFSQTTTINYLTSNLSTTACNVFYPNVAVNNITHSSLAGGVSFNTTNGIYLDAQDNSTPFSGTGFVINYNFTTGYNYDISITANGDASMDLNTSVVSNLNSFPITSIGSCTLDPKVSAWNTIGDGQLSVQCTGSSHTFNVPTFSISSGISGYLVVWATGGNPAYSFDNLTISKIVITKTALAPKVEFTLPNSIPLQCGSVTPQIFTVTNVYGTTGITNYTWNLGSASNNWLYNGSPAPQTISTGTTASIALTPVCGKNQSNIFATITANGNTYSTNTSTVSYTPPAPTINGSNAFCSNTSSYQIDGLPCNSTVVWSASPSGIVSFDRNAYPVILTKTGNGILTLTATITNDCSNISINMPITVGTPAPTFINGFPWNGTHFGANQVYEFSVTPIDGITNFQWGVSGHLNTILSGQGTNTIELQTQNVRSPDSASLYLTVKWQNACGWSDNLVREGVIYSSGGAQVIIGPNPAQSTINITADSTNVNTGALSKSNNTYQHLPIKSVLIYDQMGLLVKQQQFSPGTLQAQVNISDLRRGNYFVKTTTYSNYSETHQVTLN